MLQLLQVMVHDVACILKVAVREELVRTNGDVAAARTLMVACFYMIIICGVGIKSNPIQH